MQGIFNADDTTLMAESEEELKSWLKAQHSENEDHGIRSHHFMGNMWYIKIPKVKYVCFMIKLYTVKIPCILMCDTYMY